jgi:hypothetical protein
MDFEAYRAFYLGQPLFSLFLSSMFIFVLVQFRKFLTLFVSILLLIGLSQGFLNLQSAKAFSSQHTAYSFFQESFVGKFNHKSYSFCRFIADIKIDNYANLGESSEQNLLDIYKLPKNYCN